MENISSIAGALRFSQNKVENAKKPHYFASNMFEDATEYMLTERSAQVQGI